MPNLPIFSKKKKDQDDKTSQPKIIPVWLIAGTWVLAFLMIALLGFSLYQYFSGHSLLAFIKFPSRADSESQAIFHFAGICTNQSLKFGYPKHRSADSPADRIEERYH